MSVSDREARSIAALSHPHICTLHDVGRQDGIDYLVMEFLDGETLAARIARQASDAGRPGAGAPLSFDETLRVGTELADALAAAHRAGIVHRDLKPENIMITKRGVKVLDFGLAKFGCGRRGYGRKPGPHARADGRRGNRRHAAVHVARAARRA